MPLSFHEKRSSVAVRRPPGHLLRLRLRLLFLVVLHGTAWSTWLRCASPSWSGAATGTRSRWPPYSPRRPGATPRSASGSGSSGAGAAGRSPCRDRRPLSGCAGAARGASPSWRSAGGGSPWSPAGTSTSPPLPSPSIRPSSAWTKSNM